MVSIMPGMENFAPERTLTSSGLSAPPSFCPCSCSRCSSASSIWRLTSLETVCVRHVFAAGFGLDGEAGRNGQSGIGHLGQSGAFAAELVLHLAVTFGVAVAKEVDVLHGVLVGGRSVQFSSSSAHRRSFTGWVQPSIIRLPQAAHRVIMRIGCLRMPRPYDAQNCRHERRFWRLSSAARRAAQS